MILQIIFKRDFTWESKYALLNKQLGICLTVVHGNFQKCTDILALIITENIYLDTFYYYRFYSLKRSLGLEILKKKSTCDTAIRSFSDPKKKITI